MDVNDFSIWQLVCLYFIILFDVVVIIWLSDLF